MSIYKQIKDGRASGAIGSLSAAMMLRELEALDRRLDAAGLNTPLITRRISTLCHEIGTPHDEETRFVATWPQAFDDMVRVRSWLDTEGRALWQSLPVQSPAPPPPAALRSFQPVPGADPKKELMNWTQVHAQDVAAARSSGETMAYLDNARRLRAKANALDADGEEMWERWYNSKMLVYENHEKACRNSAQEIVNWRSLAEKNSAHVSG